MEWFEDLVGAWGLVAVFAASAAGCLARALHVRAERVAWALIGSGLLLYALGSCVYNVQLTAGGAAFPSAADALWLALYPLCFAGMVALVRARHVQVNASL